LSRHPRDAVILGYMRTPFGRYGGSLASIRPDDLASHVIRAVLERLRPVLDQLVRAEFFLSSLLLRHRRGLRGLI